LSNKLKVIDLLLLVSLLSGCNGVTGRSGWETTMQGNGQPANATSVPTSKPDNSSPSVGNTVRVARWSKDPKGGSLLALQRGTLGIVNNCLVMNDNDKNAPPTLLIFPYDNGVWDDAKQTFTFEGKVIKIGEPIKVGGGSIQDLDQLKAYGKYDVPNCGISNFFQVF
jgi:hypothetical protein